jgi:hypothetical protein
VVPSRIELESRASETLILSIVLQDQTLSAARLTSYRKGTAKLLNNIELQFNFLRFREGTGASWTIDFHFNNPCKLVLKIFTAIARRMTPKNFRIAIIPAAPIMRSMRPIDFSTMKITNRLIKMPRRTTTVS